jgi:uncharacterized metal-binding protein YceD (DUF177 family)
LDSLIEYKIPFRGIGEGEHEYDFHIQQKFFNAMESDDVQDADIKVHLHLDKQSRMMILDFDILGNLVLTCDRCLDDMDYPLDIHYRLVAKYGHKDPRDEEEDEDILYLSDDMHQLDVSQLIYENIVLAIPIKHVHADDEHGNSTCNQKQIALLENYSKKQKSDPRWDALKNIKFED